MPENVTFRTTFASVSSSCFTDCWACCSFLACLCQPLSGVSHSPSVLVDSSLTRARTSRIRRFRLAWSPVSLPPVHSGPDAPLFLGRHGAPSDGSSGDVGRPGHCCCRTRGGATCSRPAFLPATGPAAVLHRRPSAQYVGASWLGRRRRRSFHVNVSGQDRLPGVLSCVLSSTLRVFLEVCCIPGCPSGIKDFLTMLPSLLLAFALGLPSRHVVWLPSLQIKGEASISTGKGYMELDVWVC